MLTANKFKKVSQYCGTFLCIIGMKLYLQSIEYEIPLQYFSLV